MNTEPNKVMLDVITFPLPTAFTKSAVNDSIKIDRFSVFPFCRLLTLSLNTHVKNNFTESGGEQYSSVTLSIVGGQLFCPILSQ